MAIVRKTLDEIKASRPKSDIRRVAATPDEDIRRHMIEDGEDPDAPAEGFAPSAKTLRLQHGMTQEQFAAALHIPVATLRNWEQARVVPDPAAQSLLTVFAKNPRAILEALAGADPTPPDRL
jgi:putative transcriptional regulator